MNFDCPHCGQNIEAEDDWAGLQANCPTCKKLFIIPKPPQPRVKKQELSATTTAEVVAPYLGSDRDVVFWEAVRQGDLSKVKSCVAGGADPSAFETNSDRTVLLEAISQYTTRRSEIHYDIAVYLLEHGANPNIKHPKITTLTPLYSTGIISGNYTLPRAAKVVKLLLKHGADPFLTGVFDQTPLALWCENMELKRAFGYASSPLEESIQKALEALDPSLIQVPEDTSEMGSGLSEEVLRHDVLLGLKQAHLSAGTIDEFRRGQKAFADWGGLLVGTAPWVLDRVIQYVRALSAKSINCKDPIRHNWQKSDKPICIRVTCTRASGVIGSGHIGRLSDNNYAAFGFGIPQGETHEQPESKSSLQNSPSSQPTSPMRPTTKTVRPDYPEWIMVPDAATSLVIDDACQILPWETFNCPICSEWFGNLRSNDPRVKYVFNYGVRSVDGGTPQPFAKVWWTEVKCCGHRYLVSNRGS